MCVPAFGRNFQSDGTAAGQENPSFTRRKLGYFLQSELRAACFSYRNNSISYHDPQHLLPHIPQCREECILSKESSLLIASVICLHVCTHTTHSRVVAPLFTAGKLEAQCLTSLAQVGACQLRHLSAGVCGLYSQAIYITWHWGERRVRPHRHILLFNHRLVFAFFFFSVFFLFFFFQCIRMYMLKYLCGLVWRGAHLPWYRRSRAPCCLFDEHVYYCSEVL